MMSLKIVTPMMLLCLVLQMEFSKPASAADVTFDGTIRNNSLALSPDEMSSNDPIGTHCL